MEAFNTLEWIEGAINGAEGERVTCRREKIVGSNRAIRVCRTAAEEQRGSAPAMTWSGTSPASEPWGAVRKGGRKAAFLVQVRGVGSLLVAGVGER